MNIKKILNLLIILLILYLSIKYIIHIGNEISINEIIKALSNVKLKNIFLALMFTFLNYFIVIFYDVSVSKQLKLNIPFKHLSLISVITFIINNNLGFGAFLGGALRLRFLSRLKVSLKDIAKYLIIFSWVYWVGLVFLCSITFIFISPNEFLSLPFTDIQIKGFWIGFYSIIALGVFLLISIIKDVYKLEWEILFPFATSKRLIAITLISTLDWLLLSFVVFYLLPNSDIKYFKFLTKFIIAQIGAVTSHVPAGIGVFDSIMIYYFKDIFNINTLILSLLIFRVVYFIIPMIFGVLLFFVYESFWVEN